MAFKKKNVEKKYAPKYKECQKGDLIAEGVYEKCGEDNFGNPTYELRTEDNTIIVANSSGHLNYLMNEYAQFGDYCRITYEGTTVITKGRMKGKDSHVFTLEIDDERFDTSFTKDVTKKAKKIVEPTESDDMEDMVL